MKLKKMKLKHTYSKSALKFSNWLNFTFNQCIYVQI